MRVANFLLLLVILLAGNSNNVLLVHACTVFIVGKDASTDGSVMVSHSNDGEFDTDPRLVKVPAQDFDAGSKRAVYFSPESYPRYVGTDRGIPEYYPTSSANTSLFVPIGYMDQVEHTFAYLEETYGAVNEHQVGIGESTCSGVFGATPLGSPNNGTALFSVDELTHLAMERTATAREAIQLMGSLAEQYGFYGAGQFEGTAESLAVSDPNEAWIFHILPDPTGKSCIWAAQRVPDDGFAVLANMFVIREVDPDDSDNFLMSDSVHSVAKEYQWWTSKEQDGLLDFTKIYSDGEYAHKYYSGRRVWGAYHLACPSRQFPADYTDLQSDPVYPVWAKPDEPISALDLFRYHRYTYQNTPYDLGANLAAGPFGSPDRWKAGQGEKEVSGNWERPIGLYRTSDSYVVQSNKDFHSNIGAVLWFGPASAMGTVFTPFLVHMSQIPASFSTFWQGSFSRSSAFWAACVVHNVANLKWNYAIKDLQQRQDLLEQKSVQLINELQQNHTNDDYDDTVVESAIVDNAQRIVESLWKLSDELLFKYASGFVNENGDMSQRVGYPAWWLDAVGYQNGPPPPPTKPKCCNPPKCKSITTSNSSNKNSNLRMTSSSNSSSSVS